MTRLTEDPSNYATMRATPEKTNENAKFLEPAEKANILARMPPRAVLEALCESWLKDALGWKTPSPAVLAEFVAETIAMHLLAIDEARKHPIVIADAVADRVDVSLAGVHERLDRIEACMVHGKPLQPAKKKARRSRK
jgi:hypothetical protein